MSSAAIDKEPEDSQRNFSAASEKTSPPQTATEQGKYLYDLGDAQSNQLLGNSEAKNEKQDVTKSKNEKNSNPKEDLATVGYYDPYPVSWVTKKRGMVNFSLGSKRFPQVNESKLPPHLGPGSYPEATKSIKSPVMIGSPFQSTSARFKRIPADHQTAYQSYPTPVERRWKPFVMNITTSLHRTMEAPTPIHPKEILHLKKIESIPCTTPGATKNFVLTKTQMKKDYDKAILSMSDQSVMDSKSSSTMKQTTPLGLALSTPAHPFSQHYLVKPKANTPRIENVE